MIINKIKVSPLSFEEIADYLEMESDIHGYDFNISKRTFQRDLNDIRSIFSIDIQYDRNNKVYYIKEEYEPEMSEKILEAFDILNSLSAKQNLADIIHFENRQSKGTNNLNGLIHAIKNELKISFSYHKFNNKEAEKKHLSLRDKRI